MDTGNTPDLSGKDAFWASVTVPMAAEDLFLFCLDIERLFRINPYLEFERWQCLDGIYRIAGRNISQIPPFQFHYEFTLQQTPSRQLVLTYLGDSLKASTTITCEPQPHGALFSIIDDYGQLPESVRQQRLAEVDHSLVKWLEEIQSYLVLWRRWSRFGVWRWYMRRIWQPLKPSARRVVYMLLWITLVEVVFIALGAGFYMTL